MKFLSTILIITALLSPVHGYYYDYPTIVIGDYYGGGGGAVTAGGGVDLGGIIGPLLLLGIGGGLLGGIGGIAGGAAPCPGAACTTAVGCAAGYTERTTDAVRTCYKLLGPTSLNFNAAQAACAAMGGSLVSIGSVAELATIRAFILSMGEGATVPFYTGVRDFAVAETTLTNVCTGQALPAAITINPAANANADCATVTATPGPLTKNTCAVPTRAFCEQPIVNTCTCTATTTG